MRNVGFNSILCNLENSNIKKSMEEKYNFMDKKIAIIQKKFVINRKTQILKLVRNVGNTVKILFRWIKKIYILVIFY